MLTFFNKIDWVFENKNKEQSIRDLEENIIKKINVYSVETKNYNILIFSRLLIEVIIKSSNEDNRVLNSILMKKITKDSIENIQLEIDKNKKVFDSIPPVFKDKILEKIKEFDNRLTIVEEKIKNKFLNKLSKITLNNTESSILQDTYYMGSSAKYEHILLGLDVIREDKLLQLKEKFLNNNIVIIHGASGQGKSSLAYRYLHDFELISSYELRLNSNDLNLTEIINSILEISNENIIIYVDVITGNTLWSELLKSLCHKKNIKFLITIREEDWNKSSYVGDLIKLNDLNLIFDIKEAENIYNKLNKNKKELKFVDFNDAWEKFGGSGPLLEFVYLITQGNTLKSILKNQIDKLIESDNLNKINLLRLIVLSDTFGSRIKISKLKFVLKELEIKEPKKIINDLEREYFIKLDNDSGFLTGLHPIRSKIITELIFDDDFNTIDEYIILCFVVIDELDTFSFSINYFNSLNNSNSLDPNIFNISFNNYISILGFLKALIWKGINDYINLNIIWLNKLFDKFGNAWWQLLDFDQTGIIDIEKSYIIKNLNLEAKSIIYDIKKNISNKKNIFNYSKCWLNKLFLPNYENLNDKNASSFGELLFWLGHLDIKKEINYLDFKFLDNFTNFTIDIQSNILLGLNYYKIEKNFLQKIEILFIEKLKNEFFMPKIEVNNDTIKVHFIFNNKLAKILVKNELNESNSLIHDYTICILNIIRKSFPFKSEYQTQGYGHKLEILSYIDIDESKKNLSSLALPLDELTFLNRLYINIFEYKKRPENWIEYVNEIINLREDFNNITKDIIEQLKKFRVYNRDLNIKKINEYFDFYKRKSNHLKKFPKDSVDNTGFISEVNIIPDKEENKEKEKEEDKEGDKFNKKNIYISIQRFSFYKKYLDEFNRTILNFIINLKQIFIDNEGKIKNNNLVNISVNNLSDYFLNLEKFQNEFSHLFFKFVDKEKLEKIEKSEMDNLKELSVLWTYYLNNK